MKTILKALACTAIVAAPLAAHADLAYNVGLTTDYRYRGISQSRLNPALQGGVDWTQSADGGFYAGAWASTIQWTKDIEKAVGKSGNNPVEIDLYGGYKGEIVKDLTYDVGGLQYYYPRNKLDPSANTFELYGALTYQMFTLKYSHALTNTFANTDSKNSWYLDLSASFDVGGGFMLAPHVGHQKITGPYSSPASYTDYSLAVSKDFSGFVVSLAVVGTNADKSYYASPANGKFLGRTGAVLGVKYNF